MYPWLNFYCLYGFIFHGLITAFFVWLFMNGEIVPHYKGVWLGASFIFLFGLPLYFLNGAFDVNYLFIGTRSDVGVLAAIWDAIIPKYGRPAFTMVMWVVMVAVDHAFYGIYSLIALIRRHRTGSRDTDISRH